MRYNLPTAAGSARCRLHDHVLAMPEIFQQCFKRIGPVKADGLFEPGLCLETETGSSREPAHHVAQRRAVSMNMDSIGTA